MDLDDVVDTSDVDEREEFALSEYDDHWAFSSPHSTRAGLVSPHRGFPQRDQQRLSETLSVQITRQDRFSDDEVENPSPRKRIKIAHAVPTKIVLVDKDGGEQSVPFSSPRRYASPRSDWDSLFSSPPPRPMIDSDVTVQRNPDDTPGASQESTNTPFTSQPRSTTRMCPQSPDPRARHPFPTHLPSTPSPQLSYDKSSLESRRKDAMASSPLTPVPTPHRPMQPLSQSPDPLWLFSPRRVRVPNPPVSQRVGSPVVVPPDPSPPAEIPPLIPADVPIQIPDDPQPLGRYSLRHREARQLNPYAYDKLLYKQQMKFNPDAIVKFRSPPRQHQSRSGTSGEDGTQELYVYPLDNPEEDEDYVEGERRRRQRTDSLGQASEGRGGVEGATAEEVEEGWLPEALKPLSSDDDEGDDIRKLAKKARREREKAEAKARAEAKKAALEARRAEAAARKKRPKPFPIPKNTERSSGHSPEPISRSVGASVRVGSSVYMTSEQERSPSPLLFPRAQSEPAMSSLPSSPAKSPFRPPPAPSRASSHSPMPSSACYDYDAYQDDDIFFPPNLSPVNQTTSYSVPPSPSGAPPTSTASAAPSQASKTNSESESESDQPSLEISSKDRRRLRVLKRMMPAVMISRQLGAAKAPPPHPRAASVSSGSEAEEVRLIPGLARVRRGSYRHVEVRGDPESSDIEQHAVPSDDDRNEGLSAEAIEALSDGESEVKVTRIRRASPRQRSASDVISISDDSMPTSEDEEDSAGSDEEPAHRSLFDRPVGRGPTRERSLIDWMLSRTRGSGKSKAQSKQPKTSRTSHSHGPRRPRLDIVTGGARRYGKGHQTLLPFVPAAKHNNPEHRDRSASVDQDVAQEAKRRKKKKKNQGLLFNVHHDAMRLTSGHREGKSKLGRTALVIDNDDNEFRQALDPGWRAEIERWNKPVSSARQPVARPAPVAPVAPRPRLQRRTSHRGSPEPQQELPLPFYFQREEGPFATAHHHIVTDMNITPLPSGVKFSGSSYLGRGLLHQLISITSGQSEPFPPIYCNAQGFDIGPTSSAPLFSALLGPLCDRLAVSLRETETDDVAKIKEWDPVTRASSQLLSWLVVHTEDEEFGFMASALHEYTDGVLLVLESIEIGLFSLTIHWFIVELLARLTAGVKYRRGSVENEHLIQSAKRLIQRLLDIDLHPSLTTFYAAEGDVETTSLSHRATESWICLIHLFQSGGISSEPSSGPPFWRLLAELYPDSSPTGAEASEDMWRTIFNLCAISQFSLHGLSTSVFRLPPYWDLAASALKKIVLTANPDEERRLPLRALRKRDDYISCVVSRCFLLWSQWGWRLDDAIAMFKSLQEIFRSRNFVNLLNERSAPMGFLEQGDLELLSKRDPHDTAYEMFLKMVVQAVYLLNANVEMDPKHRSANVKKLLQMAVPVSPVPFSRTASPSAHALSMLVNRFSAMAVAIHLDPTPSNVKFRIGQAKRCVGFKDADDHSRMACIYGMMNFAMIVRHHKIAEGLEEVLGWLGEMTDQLMDEYKEGEGSSGAGRRAITTLIQLLIGSVRRVIETQSLDKAQTRVEYPDPALLDGPWVTRVFNPRMDLVTLQQTGVEIRMLVQSFLDARLKALPQAQLPPVVHGVESQESQDEYDKLFLDLNDAELLAALGEETQATAVADIKSKEDALCKVLDKSITPAVYRLVCKHFGENESAKDEETNTKAADEWIDCWVGCANVLVQNNHKDWGLYMKLGQQSWEKIIDGSWRRRVGLRFNLTLLRLDPGAYTKMKDDFIAVLLVATLSGKPTIEHEFISVVLSLDGLRHPLFRGAPFEHVPGTRTYEMSLVDYDAMRDRLLDTIFSNAAGCLRDKVDAESQGYVELLVVMLSTMRDIHQSYISVEKRAEYAEFCREVFIKLSVHPELVSHPRMLDLLGWVAGLGLA